MYSNNMIYSATGAGLIAALVVYMINKKLSGNDTNESKELELVSKGSSDPASTSTESSTEPSVASTTAASTTTASTTSEPSVASTTAASTTSTEPSKTVEPKPIVGGTRRKRPLRKGRKSVNKCQYCKCTQK